MHFARQITLVSLTTFAVIAASSGDLHAQARSSVEMSRPGDMTRPGEGSSVHTFQRHSYGLGGLRGASGGASSNVLSRSMSPGSSITSRTTDRHSRNSTGSFTNQPTGGAGMSSVQRYSAPNTIIRDFGGSSDIPDARRQQPLGAAYAYLEAFGSKDEDLLQIGSEPITSLAPEGDSLYARYMREAENAMAEGQYHEAASQYKLARVIGRTDPESLLGLSHAHMATAGGISYASAAYYLSQAINYFPELPLVELRPRELFGDAELYAEVVGSLRARLERNPRDGDALLCLAYLRWFEGETIVARDSLETAIRYSPDEKLKEAAEVFLEGIQRVEDGDVSETAETAEGPSQ